MFISRIPLLHFVLLGRTVPGWLVWYFIGQYHSAVVCAYSASVCNKWSPAAQSAFALQRVSIFFLNLLALSPSWFRPAPGLHRSYCCPRCLVSPGESLTVCSGFLNTSLSAALHSVELGLNLCLGSICCLRLLPSDSKRTSYLSPRPVVSN